MKTKNTLLALAVTSFLGAANCFAATNLITNGDFETGTFAGWNNASQTGSSGSRQISVPGTATPLTGGVTPPNGEGGAFYAVTDQSGPGSYALSQVFSIPSAPSRVILSFQMFNRTDALESINPGGLDYTLVPNQHARVDILGSTAGVFSTSALDVLQNFYIGINPSNPSSYTDYSFDITGLVSTPGDYMLRFAQVDNRNLFSQGVDNVSVSFEAVPEPSSVLLGTVGLIGLLRRRRRAMAA